MKSYCPVCGVERETKIVEKEKVSKIRGEEITSLSKIKVCTICNEELFDKVLDEENIQRAYNQYREKLSILFPEEIKNIREQYGLSQKTFAKLLDIGEASIARYETGALPKKSLSNMIMLLKDPKNMKTLLEKNMDKLTHKEKYKLLQKLYQLTGEVNNNEIIAKNDIQKIKKIIIPILKQNDVKNAAIFGSFARGESNVNSDIDIIIKFKEDKIKTLFDLVNLRNKLEKALNVRVDINTYEGLSPLIKEIVKKEMMVVL
jgi:putative zinc finger/helix-turn-helix YgiT family protein